jgi:hypothetical protein
MYVYCMLKKAAKLLAPWNFLLAMLYAYSVLSKPLDCSLLAYGCAGLRPGWNGKIGLVLTWQTKPQLRQSKTGLPGKGINCSKSQAMLDLNRC